MATAAITNVVLPNGFLGTLDEDEGLEDWDLGIRQRAENVIKVVYELQPMMVFACDDANITLKYDGLQSPYGPGPPAPVKLDIFTEHDLPGARGDAGQITYPNMIVSEDYEFAGIYPSGGDNHYYLVVKSWNNFVEFTSEPFEVTALPLVSGFAPDPAVFCPYTTQRECPPDPTLGLPSEVYWGVRLKYGLNANLLGYDAEGSVDEIVYGDYTGLVVEIVNMKLLRVVRSAKRIVGSCWVKWEGYDETIVEPGGEPVYWGTADPERQTSSNAADYPAYFIVPGRVVPETTEGAPHRINIRATADVAAFPGCAQVYRRDNVPVWVQYDMENP